MRNLSKINEGADVVTKDYVDSSIPTNISAFTNDSGYIKCIYIPYGDEITPSDLTAMLTDNEVICTYNIESMLINAPYIGESDESIGIAHVVGALNNSNAYFDIPFSTTPKSNGVLNVSIEFHNYDYEASVTLDYTIGRTQSITQTVFGTSVTFSYNGGSRIQINVTATGCYWSFESNIAYETQLTGHSWKFGTTINDNDTLYYYEFKASISSSSDQYVTWSAETKELGLGADKNIWFATCSTAAGTKEKIATTNSNDFVLETGNMVRVKFTYAQTYNGTATLNVDGTGARSIAVVGSTTTNRYYWTAGEVVDLVYDGTNFVMSNKGTATTTYYGLTKLSSSTSSTSTSLAATPSAVKAAYDLADSKSDFSGSYNDLTNKPTIPSAASLLNIFYPVGTIYETTVAPEIFNPNTAWGGEWTQIHGRFLVAEGNNEATGDEALNLSAGGTGGKNAYKLSAAESGMRAHTHTTGTHYHTLSEHTHSGPSHSHGVPESTSGTSETFLCLDTNIGNASFTISTSGNNRYTVGYNATGHFHTHSATKSAGTGKTGAPSKDYTSTAYNTTSGTGTPNTGGVNSISGDPATAAHENLPPYLVVYMWKRIA